MSNTAIKLIDIPVSNTITINSKLLSVDSNTKRTELITGYDLTMYLANTVLYKSQVNTTFELANSAFLIANSAYLQANSALNQANSGFVQANSGFTQANSAYNVANSALDLANSAFLIANSVILYYDAISIYNSVNSAYSQANSAYSVANTKFNSSGGTISGEVVMLSGLQVSGNVMLSGTPTQALHAAPKQYVDQVAQGIAAKPAVKAATTTNLSGSYDNGTLGVGATLNIGTAATLDIDGVTSWEQYDGVLVKNQSTGAQNGRYYVSQVGDVSNNWILTRCGYCDESSEIPSSYVFVQTGDEQNNTGWVATVEDISNFQVGANTITWFQFSGAGTYTAGNGLYLDGSVFSHGDTSNVSNLSSDNSAGSVIQDLSVTFDSYGHVTAISAATIDLDARYSNITLAYNQANSAFSQANTANTNAANASYLSTGIVSPSVLGSGTANANTYLAGDNVWKPIVSGATLTVDESSNTVYYIGLSAETTGAWLEAVISPNKLVFNPALGRLGINVADPNTSLHIAGNDAIIIPSGTDSDRPNIPVNGMLRYNTSNNYIESYSNNSWSQVGSGAGSGDLIYPVREQFVATANQSTFVVDGGYVVGELDVFYNGIKLRSGTEVNVSSGEYFSLTTPAANNALIEVIGFGSYTSYGRELSTPRREFFTATANQTSFTISEGYSPGMIDVYYNGSKLVNGQDIDVSNGLTIDLTEPASNGAIIDVVVLDALSYLDAVKKTGDIMTGNLTAVEFIGGGSGIINIDANNISSGTVNTAILGTGEANSNTYLAGDASWKSIVGFSSTDDTSSNTTYYPVIATTAGGSTAKTSSSKLYFNPSTGTLSATIFNSLSDIELKTNVINIESGLDIIEKINPVEFEWKDNGKKSFGVIAQEIEKILPDLVSTAGNKSVNYSGLIPFLIKSVQELSAKIKQIEESNGN